MTIPKAQQVKRMSNVIVERRPKSRLASRDAVLPPGTPTPRRETRLTRHCPVPRCGSSGSRRERQRSRRSPHRSLRRLRPRSRCRSRRQPLRPLQRSLEHSGEEGGLAGAQIGALSAPAEAVAGPIRGAGGTVRDRHQHRDHPPPRTCRHSGPAGARRHPAFHGDPSAIPAGAGSRRRDAARSGRQSGRARLCRASGTGASHARQAGVQGEGEEAGRRNPWVKPSAAVTPNNRASSRISAG